MHKSQKYLLAFGLIGLVSLALLFCALLPGIKSIQKAYADIRTEKEKMRNYLAEGRSIEQNKKNMVEIETGVDNLKQVFLYSGSELKFIKDLEKEARLAGVKQEIRFDNTVIEKTSADTKSIPLRIQVEGTLKQVIDYINRIERLDYYIQINSINMSAHRLQGAKLSAKQIGMEEENITKIPEQLINVELQALTYWK